MHEERDPSFICSACNGDVVVIREENGRKIYSCNNCRKGEIAECIICHKPRNIWADDGDICGICAMQYLTGKLSLTPEQVAGIMKWRARVRVSVQFEKEGLECRKLCRYSI